MSTTKIYGGPGCGKTTALINIIQQSDLPLNRIAYCTFSKKALLDMKERMKKKDASNEDLHYFRTIHSMNFHLLGIRMEQVADKKLAEFCKEKGFRLSNDIITSSSNKNEEEISELIVQSESLDDIFYHQLVDDRQQLRDKHFVHPRLRNYSAQFLRFKQQYFDWMNEHDYVDFIGMIEQGIEQAVLPPVDLICIDEWQDLNPLQIKQVTMWAANIKTSYHAGDDDQCIHEWAGAKPLAFLDFPCDEEIILHETFRLPSDILALSQRIITKNTNRRSKSLVTNKAPGGIFVKNIRATADFIKALPPTESCYVLVRNNYLKAMVRKDFMQHGIPVPGLLHERNAIELMQEGPTKKYFYPEDVAVICEGGIFPAKRYFVRGSKKKIKDLLKYPFPERGYSWEQLGKFGLTGDFFEDFYTGTISNLNIDPDERSYILKLFANYGKIFKPISIMTIHQAKGLEADTVVLITDIARRTYESVTTSTEMEAERRVWYTGITRTIKRIICVKDTHYSKYHTPIQNMIEVFCQQQVG